MPAEGVKTVVPERAIRREPRVQLGQGRRVQVVQATLSVPSDLHQPVVSKHPKMLRDAGLTQPSPLNDLANRPRPLPKQIEDLAPTGFHNSSERICHRSYITTEATLRKGSDPWLRVRNATGRPGGRPVCTSGRYVPGQPAAISVGSWACSTS